MSPLLVALGWRFLFMAFLAIGGANAVIPEMHRQVVAVERWMTDADFAALFAIASAAPGPNLLIVTLVGWKVAGIAGALVATVAFVLPTSLLTFGVFFAWTRLRSGGWQRPVQNGLAAVTVGLIAASAFLLAWAADTGPLTGAITVGTVLLSYRTRLNPLWFFAVAAALGAVFLG